MVAPVAGTVENISVFAQMNMKELSARHFQVLLDCFDSSKKWDTTVKIL